MIPQTIPQTVLDGLRAIVDDAGFVTDQDVIAPHLVEPRNKWHGATTLMLRPTNTQQVSDICKLCHNAHVPLVPQGGNTGNVGAQTPHADDNAVLLSLERMNNIRSIDTGGNQMIVEAGVILATVQEAAASHDRLFPLSLAAEQSCTIGGNLATNAGGTAVLAYGNMRDLCLGIEIVLPDGRIMDLLDGLHKDNTGYDLKHLFIGAEGTLGVITAAVLKLFPAPRDVATMMLAIDDPQAGLDILSSLQAASGNRVTACEIMPKLALEFLETHKVATSPLQPLPPFALLVEIADAPQDAVDTALQNAIDNGLISNAVRAASNAQAAALWHIREAIPDVQKREGGSIKHDIAVPISAVPAFWKDAGALVQRLVPGARICAFGHIGDGNLHFNISQPIGADADSFLAEWDRVESAMFALVNRYGGTISAEHGIGQLKRGALKTYKDPVALATMQAIKQVLDPHNIMNPGKLLP